MNDPLICARAIHFIATMMAAGAVFFAVFVGEPAFAKTAADHSLVVALRHRLAWIAWLSFGVALLSGLAWLVLTAQDVSEQTLAAVFSNNVIGIVLTRTAFGHDWIARLVLALLFAAVLLWMHRGRPTGSLRIGAVAIAAAVVGTLAWAGHAVGTEGVAGGVHLTADVLHLIAAAAWVGALLPLALLLHAVRVDPDERSLAVAHAAVRRFSTLGVASVATILASGTVNTWFLAGSVPALVGTDYGRLLLVKIALFLVMVSIAAVNRYWITPRLAGVQGIAANRRALRQLRRNSAIEALFGVIILCIVGVLGTMVPGLHQQAIWPFAFRLDASVFSDPDLYVFILFGAAWIAAGIYLRQFRWPAIAVGVGILIVVALRLPFIEAYPTTYFGSPTGFSAQSVAQGASLFAAHCASCHGPEGRGDGPAAASLNPPPADLTADHIYAHTDGDLFWWITHGIAPAMPPFGDRLGDDARWNLVDFIHANADATRLRAYGAGTTAAFPTPDFSVECPDGSMQSIAQLRPQVVHIVVADPGSQDRLRQLAALDRAEKLRTVIVEPRPEAAQNIMMCVAQEPETINAFALYSGDASVEGTQFLVDADGNLRSMWRADETANGDVNSVEQRVKGLRLAPRVQRPSGSMEGHHHH
jgi:putative copper export protein/mono/diheme cytochrome c family protein